MTKAIQQMATTLVATHARHLSRLIVSFKSTARSWALRAAVLAVLSGVPGLRAERSIQAIDS
jgi:hypothetical protein